MNGVSLIIAGCSAFAATAHADATVPPTIADVATRYADLASNSYSGAANAARAVKDSVALFVANPSPETLAEARQSWVTAHRAYDPTEVFRFYGGPIDDARALEPKLNAWPMDEAYVDYVEGLPDAGIVNHPAEFPSLDKETIAALNEKDGETNIASGFHAIEFLLWGQDQSVDGPGARPHTDYIEANSPNAKRRATYLLHATELVVEHLEAVANDWKTGEDNYRKTFLAAKPVEAIRKILTGMAMLSGEEIAHERMFVAYDTQDPEDEQSCFSDETLGCLRGNALGIQTVWRGTNGIMDLVKASDPKLADDLDKAIGLSIVAIEAIPAPFDQAIQGEDTAPGRTKIREAVQALEAQTELLSRAAETLGVPINLQAAEGD